MEASIDATVKADDSKRKRGFLSRGELGGTGVDWGRALTASLWATFALALIGYLSMLPFNVPLKEVSLIFKDWIVHSRPPPVADAIGVAVIDIAWGFLLGFGYAFFHRGLPGKRLSKGITYGVCICR